MLGAGATLLVPALHYVLQESRPTGHGRLPLEPGLMVAAGGAVGGLVGAYLIRYLSPARLRQMFGAAMVAAALRMLWG